MTYLTVRCPYCHQPATARTGLLDHYVIEPHQLTRAAYLKLHSHTPTLPIDARLGQCPASELVLHQTDPRFHELPHPDEPERVAPPPIDDPHAADSPY